MPSDLISGRAKVSEGDVPCPPTCGKKPTQVWPVNSEFSLSSIDRPNFTILPLSEGFFRPHWLQIFYEFRSIFYHRVHTKVVNWNLQVLCCSPVPAIADSKILFNFKKICLLILKIFKNLDSKQDSVAIEHNPGSRKAWIFRLVRIPAHHLWITKWVNGVHASIHYHLKQILCKYFTVHRKMMKTKPVPRPPLPCNPCLHCWLTEFAVVNLNLTWWIWICSSELEFAVILNLLWWIWIWCDQFRFSAVNLNFPWWIWNCHKWIRICCNEFELAVVNLNLMN